MTHSKAPGLAAADIETMKLEDYDYIVRIVQYVERGYGIRFFITSRDFDVLYRWWEKRIPLDIVKESLGTVVARRRGKGQKILGYRHFNYEVKKNYRRFLELNVGEEGRIEERENNGEVARFFQNFPPQLAALREDFDKLLRKLENRQNPDMSSIHEALLELLSGDNELNVRTRVFLQNLAPELRTPEIEKRYRLNYLLHKFHIPDFESFSEVEDGAKKE
jgi:hypothetical protein